MPGLTLDIARQCLDRAMAKARQDFTKPICVSVCDAQGFLLAFARMGVSTQAVLERLKTEGIEIAYFCDPLMTALPGGSVLKESSGTMIGAVGVSGLTAAQDQMITDAVAGLVLSGK